MQTDPNKRKEAREISRILREPTDLSEFLRKNDRLIEALGLFTALTVFSLSFGPQYVRDGVSLLFLTITTILFLELRSTFPVGLNLSARPGEVLLLVRTIQERWKERITQFAILLDIAFAILIFATMLSYKYYVLASIALIAIVLIVFRIVRALVWVSKVTASTVDIVALRRIVVQLPYVVTALLAALGIFYLWNDNELPLITRISATLAIATLAASYSARASVRLRTRLDREAEIAMIDRFTGLLKQMRDSKDVEASLLSQDSRHEAELRREIEEIDSRIETLSQFKKELKTPQSLALRDDDDEEA